jgi:hypothetical protein
MNNCIQDHVRREHPEVEVEVWPQTYNQYTHKVW